MRRPLPASATNGARFDQSGLDAEARRTDLRRIFRALPARIAESRRRPAPISAPAAAAGRRVIAPQGREADLRRCQRGGARTSRGVILPAFANCEFVHSTIDAMPIAPASLDFGYSLGVLHHIPDTAAAMRACVATLKPGAPLLALSLLPVRQQAALVCLAVEAFRGRAARRQPDAARPALSGQPADRLHGLLAARSPCPPCRAAWLQGRAISRSLITAPSPFT